MGGLRGFRNVLLVVTGSLIAGNVVKRFPGGSVVYGALGVVLLIMLLGGLLSSYRASCYREKARPYECGFEPIGSARRPFSLRFFVLAMLFLVFDAEVVLLFPVLEAFRTGAVSSRVVW